jgi:hypothetical protein
MAVETIRQTETATPATPHAPVAPLESVLRAIRGDSRDEPKVYLDEVQSPKGGE